MVGHRRDRQRHRVGGRLPGARPRERFEDLEGLQRDRRARHRPSPRSFAPSETSPRSNAGRCDAVPGRSFGLAVPRRHVWGPRSATRSDGRCRLNRLRVRGARCSIHRGGHWADPRARSGERLRARRRRPRRAGRRPRPGRRCARASTRHRATGPARWSRSCETGTGRGIMLDRHGRVRACAGGTRRGVRSVKAAGHEATTPQRPRRTRSSAGPSRDAVAPAQARSGRGLGARPPRARLNGDRGGRAGGSVRRRRRGRGARPPRRSGRRAPHP